MANPQDSSVRHDGAVPSAVNCVLAGSYLLVNVYQFVVLPLWLLPSARPWGWTLLPFALLNNPFWSLLHEAIHDLLHANRRVNGVIGRGLAILFGSPFRILRLSHLLHHKLNRLPVEGTEYYDRDKSTKAAAAPGYFFQILIGLYLVEVVSPMLFLLPRAWLQWFKARYMPPQSVSAILMQNWLGAEALREIRVDGLLTLTWLSLSFWLYGENWPMLLALLLARGFLISFLDNVYHYATPVSDIFYAKNLCLPAPLSKLLLNFNLHGIHHINPAISWIHLPKAFAVQAGKVQGGYFAAALSQFGGPIALQDLPQSGVALSLRAE
ncbi:MAG: fatty acid desaturase [Deltaproteobacteria bacterium]|nr:fatty acid desaturase [Deltaproteobacteria bacterium]